MGKFAVRGDRHDSGIALLELRQPVGEFIDFRRSDEREVERIEEQNQPLSAVIFQRYAFEISLDDAIERELGRFLTDTNRHEFSPFGLMLCAHFFITKVVVCQEMRVHCENCSCE